MPKARQSPPQTKQERELMRDVAVMRYMGGTQQDTADRAGISVAALRSWEAADWWLDIVRDVQRKHISEMAAHARKVVHRTIKLGLRDDVSARERKLAYDASKWLLERQDEAFQEPEKRVRVETEAVPRNLEDLSVGELRRLAEGFRQQEMLEAEVLSVGQIEENPGSTGEEEPD